MTYLVVFMYLLFGSFLGLAVWLVYDRSRSTSTLVRTMIRFALKWPFIVFAFALVMGYRTVLRLFGR